MKSRYAHLLVSGLLLGASLTTILAANQRPSVAPAVGADSAAPTPRQNFTRWSQTASRFGVHEVFLTRDHTPERPFDLAVQVTFTPPSGGANAKIVEAFYDGGNVWRTRVYVSESGRWTWVSRCAADPKLDGRQGTFEAAPSSLRRRLLAHPRNPTQWIRENGKWFLNLNDTAYLMFLGRDGLGREVSVADFQRYVGDDHALGLTSVRSMLASAYDSAQSVFFQVQSAHWRDHAPRRVHRQEAPRLGFPRRWRLGARAR